MRKVIVVGTGYVGTVTAACMAWLGQEVVGVDVDPVRAGQLDCGQLPFFEPYLDELLREALAKGRLSFTSQLGATVGADFVFLCVGTPPGEGGVPDMSQVETAVRSVAPHLKAGAIIVDKSTVPVGSGDWVRTTVEDALPRSHPGRFAVVSNPEFLREGSAVEDFLHPDRIVLGGESPSLEEVARLYEPVLSQDFVGGRPHRRPHLVSMTLASAEMTKYAANAFLATKISFANEMANICELVGADARQVLPAIGMDRRIGRGFLGHGLGWGGSCFGKDVTALVATGLDYGYEASILRATVQVNEYQRAAAIRKLQAWLKVLKGKRIGVLGLAFKAGTDDLRDSAALDIVHRLIHNGAVVTAYDPAVKDLGEHHVTGLRLARDPYDVADRADALLVATDWPEFASLDLARLAVRMSGRYVLDGRGVLDVAAASAAGLAVGGFGW